MNKVSPQVQAITIQFDDGFEVCLMLDSVVGMQHPEEEQFVMLNVPVFTSQGSGTLVVTPRQMDSFMKNGLMREAHRWLTKKM